MHVVVMRGAQWATEHDHNPRKPRGYWDTVEVEAESVIEAAEECFHLFNRGSGQELVFEGPSMSVGDTVVVVSHDGEPPVTLRCASFGWEPIA